MDVKYMYMYMYDGSRKRYMYERIYYLGLDFRVL